MVARTCSGLRPVVAVGSALALAVLARARAPAARACDGDNAMTNDRSLPTRGKWRLQAILLKLSYALLAAWGLGIAVAA